MPHATAYYLKKVMAKLLHKLHLSVSPASPTHASSDSEAGRRQVIDVYCLDVISDQTENVTFSHKMMHIVTVESHTI